jgi:predicted nucleic acid-binding protein
VWIPEEVKAEFLGTDRMPRLQALNDALWIKTVHLTDARDISTYMRSGLDLGEAAVLALAKEHDAQFVIIDELKARQHAARIGLSFKGTLGILQQAKDAGLVDAIKPLLIQLQDNGIHLSESLINNALQDAGEAD